MSSTENRGFIVPIGGAEEKAGEMDILRRFADVCGGRSARIAVIPTASESPDTGPRHRPPVREDIPGAERARRARPAHRVTLRL